MTIQALAWAIDQPLPDKPKLVLMALANHADHTNGHVDVDPVTLAREASIKQVSLWRYLGALERNGYLAKDVKRTSEGERRDYWLTLDRDPALPWEWDAPAADKLDEAATASIEHPAAPPESAPSTFRRDDQDAQRKGIIDKPDPNRPAGLVPVIEGSRAHDAWQRHHRAIRRILPFVRTIIIEGKERRGFFMPTLFPPSENQQAEVA